MLEVDPGYRRGSKQTVARGSATDVMSARVESVHHLRVEAVLDQQDTFLRAPARPRQRLRNIEVVVDDGVDDLHERLNLSIRTRRHKREDAPTIADDRWRQGVHRATPG